MAKNPSLEQKKPSSFVIKLPLTSLVKIMEIKKKYMIAHNVNKTYASIVEFIIDDYFKTIEKAS